MQKSANEATSRSLPSRIRTAVGAEVHDAERGRIHLCHGYDLYNDLLDKYSWSELIYLHLKGELPGREQAEVFDFILRSVINPGPTDWATQAAMTAAVTHSPVGNSLLAGLAVLQGRFNGALEVEMAMQMLSDLVRLPSSIDAKSSAEISSSYPDLPGIARQGSTDNERVGKIVNRVLTLSSNDQHLQTALSVAHQNGHYISKLGLFAATLCDLGFSPRQGHGLYLLAAAPGILAHLLEQMQGDWSSYPFGSPPEYTGTKDRELADDQRCYKTI